MLDPRLQGSSGVLVESLLGRRGLKAKGLVNRPVDEFSLV